MKKLVNLALGLMLGVGVAVLAYADDTRPSSPPMPFSQTSQVVKGDVLMIEGDFYVVKDITGRETRLHVSADTKMDAKVKVGDKIEAHVTPDGHAKSITLQIQQEGAAKEPRS
jgi:hypothetical protein